MKVTKYTVYISIFLFLIACSKDDRDRVFDSNDEQFVRFFLLVDNNNIPLEYPQVNGGLIPVDTYQKDQLGTLKIPVALSATDFEGDISVNFSTEISNMTQDVTISPSNTLVFSPQQLTDTIYVNFNSNWNGIDNASIKFKLTEVSNPSISIGIPNSELPNDELTINLEDVDFAYRLENSLIELVGNANEEKLITINFPNGFFVEDIETISLLEETTNDNVTINYSLEQLPIESGSNRVQYKYTVIDPLNIDEFQYETSFQLAEIPNYSITGFSEITLRKSVVTPRDNDTFTSNNFYNLSDPFYRTYGENWMDSNEDAICAWQAFNAFTYPVIVDENHPNAILDDMGTPNDTSDDIYVHAFRVGFNSPNAGNTTNSFNLKRWFNNESTSAANSPGFNIEEALEFYPTNGNSPTDGLVQVIEQDLVIAGTNGNSYVISIKGNGTYAEIQPGLFEIIFTLEATNNELFGGTRFAEYRIYNSNSYTDPIDLTNDCFIPTDL